ncbi:hypothetical protein GCM10009721_26700 [Terrabacter tumescens]|uniref:Uncharacterized protein n=1 Tax=Terrabacter tumescens TaxID=60443 RepID=A0ABQ2I2A5_9MICO|nr:hypothetical protein GCM10009721_26700 [Terrabacter tumescens]
MIGAITPIAPVHGVPDVEPPAMAGAVEVAAGVSPPAQAASAIPDAIIPTRIFVAARMWPTLHVVRSGDGRHTTGMLPSVQQN